MRRTLFHRIKTVPSSISKLLRFLLIPAVDEKVCPFRVYLTWFLVFLVLLYIPKLTHTGRIVTSKPEDLLALLECSDYQTKGYCCPTLVEYPLVEYSRNFIPSFLDIVKSNSHVCDGGWQPSDCHLIQKVAVIIPYRDREMHLRLLLPRLHSLLFRQQVAYRIFVVEQAGNVSFNRGLLINVGIMESLKLDPTINCFIFHDVDLLPENSLNLYACDNALRHLSSAIDDFRYHTPFRNYAGGVSAMSKSNIFKINGFPTRYWGWGSEDDEFSARALHHNLPLTRPPTHIGRYKAPRHIKASISVGHQSDFMQYENYLHDGLKRLEKEGYQLVRPNQLPQYGRQTWLRLPTPLHPCAIRTISSSLGLSPNRLVYTNRSVPLIPLGTLEEAARQVLFTHIIVDPTELFNTTPHLEAVGNHPHKSLLWFLSFYGWI